MSFIIILLIAGIFSLVIVIFSWKRRPTPGAGPLAALMMAGGLWSFIYILELANQDLSIKIFWAKVEYLGIVFIPICWFFMALEYTERKKIMTIGNLILLSIIPISTLLVVWTNEYHYLFWSSFDPASDGLSGINPAHGPWFWVFASFSHSVIFLGTLLILIKLVNQKNLYRLQSVILIIGMIAPWIGNILYLMKISIVPNVDNTPLFFTFTGLALYWGFTRGHILDIVPIAREAVIENMNEKFIILDKKLRILDINPAAEDLFSTNASKVIGHPVIKIIPSLNKLKIDYFGIKGIQSEISLQGKKEKQYFEVRLSPIIDNDIFAGYLLILYEITRRKRAEKNLSKTLNELEDRVSDRTKDLSEAVNALEQEVKIRTKAEDALKESEEKLRLIIASSPNAITMTNLEGTVVECNQATLDLHGFSSRDEIIGKSSLELISKRDHERSIENMKRTHDQGHLKNTEYTLLTKQGEEFPGELSAGIIKDLSGKPVGYVAITRNISERKEYEELIKEKARDEIYGLFASALPIFTSHIPQRAWSVLIGSFANRFEKNIKPRFEEYIVSEGCVLNNVKDTAKDEREIFDAYISWISDLFSNFGIQTRVDRKESTTLFEILSCPWKEEAHGNPLFCLMCRAMIIRSYTWTTLSGEIAQISSISDGSESCRFDLPFHDKE